jgi:tRNA pseudouridine38/39 synthase
MTAVYDSWSKEQLIQRIRELDRKLDKNKATSSTKGSKADPAKRKLHKPFDFASHPKRKIALKFCYAGAHYNGLAFQTDYTPLPTVEGVLFEALAETRLIDPLAGFEGCEWSRCGRTDRGVSAAGQVISLYVRSALRSLDAAEATTRETRVDAFAPEDTATLPDAADSIIANPGEDVESPLALMDLDDEPRTSPPKPPKRDIEFHYVDMLNRVLPSTIRILAWSSVESSFDARFSCTFRHYKYFFDSSDLSIPLMQDAAARLVGEHDFRNLCKIDPSKQISNYHRLVTRAEVSYLDPSQNKQGLCVLDVVGNGFLYHQIRHIMAVLFLVGSKMEAPSIISALLNADPNQPNASYTDEEQNPPVVDRKPVYQMADGLPLVLWDCGYREDCVSWRSDGLDGPKRDERDVAAGSANLLHHLECTKQRSSIEAALQEHFILAARRYQEPRLPVDPISPGQGNGSNVLQIPLGGGVYKRTHKYVPLLERERNEHADVVNERWRVNKGVRSTRIELQEEE